MVGLDGGRFGQGLYTLFGDFDEVRVKSGAGDGKVYDVVVTRKDGRLWIKSFEERAGDERGTTIERVKRLDREQRIPVELEAAFVTSALYEYAGAVRDVDILYQGEKANEPVAEIASVDVGAWGRLRVTEAPSRLARITQDDLPVADPGLRAELTALLPDWMQRLWRERGYSIDLPGKLPLVRSRAGLAQREKVLADLQNAMMALGVQLAVKLYFQEGLALPGLPEDFYSRGRGYDVDQKERRRTRLRYNSGRWSEVDWSRYASDGLALGRLMSP